MTQWRKHILLKSIIRKTLGIKDHVVRRTRREENSLVVELDRHKGRSLPCSRYGEDSAIGGADRSPSTGRRGRTNRVEIDPPFLLELQSPYGLLPFQQNHPQELRTTLYSTVFCPAHGEHLKRTRGRVRMVSPNTITQPPLTTPLSASATCGMAVSAMVLQARTPALPL